MMRMGLLLEQRLPVRFQEVRQMSQSIKIDFVALAPVTAQTPPQAAKRSGKSKPAQTLVIFMGPEFSFGAATKKLIGNEGEALIKRAAGATKFKGKEQTALDIVAPSGFVADRLLVIGAGAPSDVQAKGKASKEAPAKTNAADSKPAEKPADYISLGGYALGKLGAGAAALVAFDLPYTPKDAGLAAAEFVEGMRLRDYKFDAYKTKKKDDEEASGTEISVAVADPAAAKREAKARDAEAEGVVIARDLVNEPANVLYPEEFARRAQALEKLGVEVEVLDEAAMKKLGMGALLGVGQGSDAREPSWWSCAGRAARRKEHEQADRLHRQGRLLRYRRHLDQARRRHGGHEGRHGGRRLRRRPDACARRAQGQGQCGRRHRPRREYAGRRRRSGRATSSRPCRARRSR